MFDGDTPPTPRLPDPPSCEDCAAFPGWREVARHFRRPWPAETREWWRIHNQPARGPATPECVVALLPCSCPLGARRGESFEVIVERWRTVPGHVRTFVSSRTELTLTPGHRETIAQFATRTRGYPELVRAPVEYGRIWAALLDDFRLGDP